MGNQPLTFWNSGIWLIPLILAATIAVLVLLARRLRASAQANIKEARSELRSLSGRRRQVAGLTASHSIADDEPYQTRMTELQDQLDQIDVQIRALDRQFIDLQGETRRLGSGKGMAMIGAPFFWYQLKQQSESLRQKTANLEPALEAAELSGRRVEQVAWEVALDARQVRSVQTQTSRLLDGLTAQNVRGAALDAALLQQQACLQAMGSIPALFLEADEATVLRQVDKETVVQVHAILVQESPALEALLAQAREWDKQQREAVEAVGLVRQQISRAEASMLECPAGLDLEAEKKALGNLLVIGDHLYATLARMEVESLPVVAAEARRVRQAGQNLAEQVQQARQDLAVMEKSLPELAQGLRSITIQFAALAAATVRPIAWGQSRASLTSINRQVNSLQSARQPRPPIKLRQDLETVQHLQKQVLELSDSCQASGAQQRELVDLLSQPNLAEWRDWAADSQDLIEDISVYSPENWPRQDNLASLSADLAALTAGLDKLAGDDLSQPVEESQLAQVLDETRRYVQAYQAQRQRTANISSRLSEIQAADKSASERIEHTILLFQQATLLVNSNAFLTSVTAGEPARLKSELTAAANELRQRERGTVEKKSRQVEAVIGKTIQSCATWLEKLTADLQAHNQELSKTLASLAAITALDEPAVYQARELLNAGPAHTGRYSGSPPSLEGLLTEIKRRSDYWNRLTAARRALEDAVRPVLENYQGASDNRQFARNEIQEIANWMRSTHGWPPASISLQAERQELAGLEEQWEGLKIQRLRSVQLAAQLSGLSARFLALGNRSHQAGERFAQDQAQVTDLENEYNELVGLWQTQARTYAENPQTTQEIRDLLERSDRELTSIRQGYRRGTRNYNQVLQGLRGLVRNLRGFPAVVDENRTVDVYGHEKRAR